MSATLHCIKLKTALSKRFKQPATVFPVRRAIAPGITLLETALGMMILSILSIGVSSIVKAGIEAQMSERTHQHMQTIGMNIVDDLRNDIRVADEVTVTNSSTLTVLLDDVTNQTAVYQLVGTQFQRRETGKQTKIYNDPNMYSTLMEISCPSGCFQAQKPNSSSMPKQILLPKIMISKPQNSTAIDKYFAPPNFTISNFAFDVATATEFR
jgi:hypothetical protein